MLSGEKVFIYQRNQMTGLGSVLLTFFMFCIYYEEHHDRRIAILDDTFSQTYRKSKEVGLQGFLDFNFPVMNTPEEYQQVFQELNQVQMGHLTNENDWVDHMWNKTTTKDYPILRIRQFKDPRYFQDKRKEIFELYKYDGNNDPRMFERISQRICDNVSLNDEMLRDIHVILQNASIPDYAYSVQANFIFEHHNDNTNNTTNNNINPSTPSTPPSSSSPSLGPTVAFHVRRGDKVHGKRSESKLYLEEMYVDKMLQIPNIPLQDIQHCYVATDEYNVTLGLKESLLRRNITCQLHYLVPSNRDKDNLSDRHNQDDTKMFFTEMYMLTQATYFVGTFNSNVGAFVAAFRRCHWEGEIGSMSDRYHHFFQSYGVDRENWFIRK
ncbi:GDP-fucose protein O-fucosyltransferase [Nitzschia inconspicua]|uniref:GDP-fucose protein O-fucosyltransferase n=1 Tax=Nitzschia inconspicua TaxID=303405 RepID=A0A9K3PFV2_9STRA|nr:GDP-fucose protein O-fucosyltransferase [Nitzschia inconspicua]